MVRYCKREMEEYNNGTYPKSLLNELIIFTGYLSHEDTTAQKKIC